MKGTERRNPVIYYFIFTFLVSWFGIILASLSMGMPTTEVQFREDGPVALMPLLIGPAAVGLVMTGIAYGRTGFRDLWKRFLNWRIGIWPYLISVLVFPAMLSVILLVLSRYSGDFIPKIMNEEDKVSFAVTGLIMGFLGGGILEETGWTGFALPALRKRYGVFKSGLILGLVWAVWHFLPVYWGSGDAYGHINWSLFLPGLFCHYTVLVSYRILMVWMHEKTGSMIPVIILHGVLGTSINFVLNISVGGRPLFIYYLVIAVLLWAIIGVLFLRKRFRLTGL